MGQSLGEIRSKIDDSMKNLPDHEKVMKVGRIGAIEGVEGPINKVGGTEIYYVDKRSVGYLSSNGDYQENGNGLEKGEGYRFLMSCARVSCMDGASVSRSTGNMTCHWERVNYLGRRNQSLMVIFRIDGDGCWFVGNRRVSD